MPAFPASPAPRQSRPASFPLRLAAAAFPDALRASSSTQGADCALRNSLKTNTRCTLSSTHNFDPSEWQDATVTGRENLSAGSLLRRAGSLPNMAHMNCRPKIRQQLRRATGALDCEALAPSRHFYSTMNPNRNARNSMKTNNRCTFYSTITRGAAQRARASENCPARASEK